MNKKRLKVRVFAVLFAMLSSSSAFAITINFQPLSTSAYIGETIDVDVVVSGLISVNEIVSTYDLFIGYDAATLNASSVSFGPYLDDFLYPSFQFEDLNTPGSLNFGEISFLFDDELAVLQPDSFTLATISFDAIAIGNSELTFEPHPFFGVIDIKGREAQILSLDAGTGLINVMESPVSVPEPESFLLLLVGLLLLTMSSHQFVIHRQ